MFRYNREKPFKTFFFLNYFRHVFLLSRPDFSVRVVSSGKSTSSPASCLRWRLLTPHHPFNYAGRMFHLVIYFYDEVSWLFFVIRRATHERIHGTHVCRHPSVARLYVTHRLNRLDLIYRLSISLHVIVFFWWRRLRCLTGMTYRVTRDTFGDD